MTYVLQHSIAFDGCNRMIREGESLDVRNNIDPAKADNIYIHERLWSYRAPAPPKNNFIPVQSGKNDSLRL